LGNYCPSDLLLSATLFATAPNEALLGETYDPCADTNDDGKIDGKDIAFVAKGYDSKGTPITKAAFLYDSGWIDVENGLCWFYTTPNSIRLYRGITDPYWNYVRVRIWKIKETP